jgi:hypothetical protein
MAPDAATCSIVAATVLPLAGQDPARYLSLTMALAPAGIFLIISIAAAKAPIRFILDRTGATERIGSDRHYPSVAAAVESLLQM